jgi:antitoxin VapB
VAVRYAVGANIIFDKVVTQVYTNCEVIKVQTAKLFASGKSQAVRLPKEFRFEGNEVGISKFGKTVILFPKKNADDIFFASLGKFTDDVFVSIESSRAENKPSTQREDI